MSGLTGRKVRIGIVGLRLGQWHVETLQAMEDVEIAAVAENSPSIDVDDYAARIGARAYRDGVEMIRREPLDGVSLCVSPKWRLPLVQAAAERRLPTIMEKPWGAHMAHGRQLADVARAAGIILMPEFPLRYFPPLTTLKGLLDEGTLGRPYMLCGDLNMAFVAPAQHWMWDAENGNGLLNENTCHLVDTACYLLGDPVEVFAMLDRFTGAPMEDGGVISLRFKNGAVSTLCGGGHSAQALDTRTWLNVYAEGGQGLVTGVAHMYDTLTWGMRGPGQQAVTETWPNPPRRQIMRYSLRHFVDCLKSGQPPSCTPEDGLRALAVIMAAKQSSDRNAPVPVVW